MIGVPPNAKMLKSQRPLDDGDVLAISIFYRLTHRGRPEARVTINVFEKAPLPRLGSLSFWAFNFRAIQEIAVNRWVKGTRFCRSMPVSAVSKHLGMGETPVLQKSIRR